MPIIIDKKFQDHEYLYYGGNCLLKTILLQMNLILKEITFKSLIKFEYFLIFVLFTK